MGSRKTTDIRKGRYTTAAGHHMFSRFLLELASNYAVVWGMLGILGMEFHHSSSSESSPQDDALAVQSFPMNNGAINNGDDDADDDADDDDDGSYVRTFGSEQ